MAIFRGRLTPEQIRTYTHYGRFLGLVPIYFAEEGADGCRLAVRNGWPEWLLDVANALFFVWCYVATTLVPDLEPRFPIVLTGEIER
jgi:hypothetical protein